MNVHDSDRMEGVLRSHGFSRAESIEAADLVVFNTCSVREKAEQKLRSEVGKLAPLKQRRPDLVIAVAGCVAEQEGKALLRSVPLVDLVVGPDHAAELPELVMAQLAGAPPTFRTGFDVASPTFLSASPEPGRAPVRAFVTTMKGCDERCSFCVVPYTRGPERYRPAGDIVREIASWVEAGAREVLLLGQTVDSYRDASLPLPASDDPDESQFPALLRRIARDVPGLARLRYTSPHPRHLTAALTAAHAELDVLARHVHMPVQSGSDRVLKRMIRRHTRAEYLTRVARLLGARDGLTLSTDIIVGFPGETEEDFQATLSLVQDVGFVGLFGFKYSPRPHTPALKLGDDVPEEVKAERLARLFEVAEAQQRAHLASLVGTTQAVLVEGESREGAEAARRFSGRTARNEIVHLPAEAGLAPGALVQVSITRAFKHSLEGAPTDAWRASAAPSGGAPGAPVRRRLPLATAAEGA
jgi:tRNA-2-methylthio-N6-dimethylallyladenosine synthase